MAGRRAARDAITREQWAAHVESLARDRTDQGAADGGSADSGSAHTGPTTGDPTDGAGRGSRRGRERLTAERIVSAALDTIQTTGFEDLTMRSVATVLDTGPASLYAHVRNKAELGDLLIGELCSRVRLPAPDPAHWQEQFLDVCTQLRDQFLTYPGVARAALAVVPADLGTLRLAEAMLAVLRAGGVPAQTAAWAADTAFLYVTAYCLEAADAQRQHADVDGDVIDAAEIAERLRMLPPDQFPHTVALAQQLTAGSGHDRFDFALGLLVRGLR
ncbi:MAG: TetR/AcrR family transcriptional regulator [Janthinobacterium lividum]